MPGAIRARSADRQRMLRRIGHGRVESRRDPHRRGQERLQGWRRRAGRVTTPVTPASVLGAPRAAGFGVIITTLGVAQIVAWGSSYYLPAVLATPISDDTGWP